MAELDGINLAMQTPMHADGGSVRAPLQNLDEAAVRELEACLEPLNQD